MKESTKIDLLNDLQILAIQISRMKMPQPLDSVSEFQLSQVPVHLKGYEYSQSEQGLFFCFTAAMQKHQKCIAWDVDFVKKGHDLLRQSDIDNDFVSWNRLQFDAAVTFSKVTNNKVGIDPAVIDAFQHGYVLEDDLMPILDLQ